MTSDLGSGPSQPNEEFGKLAELAKEGPEKPEVIEVKKEIKKDPKKDAGRKDGKMKGFFRRVLKKEDSQQLEEEVMSMLEQGQESGIFKEEGKKMINSIFAFDDKLAYEIMTPRTDVFVIDIDDPPEKYMEDFMKLRYSRIPVCKGDTDNIVGILHIKDYLIQAWEKGFDGVEIASIIRKAYFEPEIGRAHV